jgi:RNA polymerase sigma-70 factor, ECF subfamily
VRDAGPRLLEWLSPQERAAIVLEEVFDMTLEEIAELLAHDDWRRQGRAAPRTRSPRRARGTSPSRRAGPSPELLDRFIERYNARDVKGLTELMLAGGSAENVGNSFHVGSRAHLASSTQS